jgi:hypothetical protein
MDITNAIKGKFEIETKVNTQKFNLFKLKIKA